MKSQILIYTLVLTGMLIICFAPALTLNYLYKNNSWGFKENTESELNQLLSNIGLVLSQDGKIIKTPITESAVKIPAQTAPLVPNSITDTFSTNSTKYTQYAMENGNLITDLYQTNDKILMYKTYFRDCYTGEVTGNYTQFRGSWCFIPEDALELRRLFKVYFTVDLTVTQKRAYESEIFSIMNKGIPK